MAGQEDRFLFKRGNSFFVSVTVPPKVRPFLGNKRKLVKTTGTSDKAEAKARHLHIVATLKDQINAARAAGNGRPAPKPFNALTMDEALLFRAALQDAERGVQGGVTGGHETESEADTIREAAEQRADQVRQRRSQGPTVADAFLGVVAGTATPVTLHLERWLQEGGTRGAFAMRTAGDHRRAVAELAKWMDDAGHPATIEAATRRVIGQFMSEHLLQSGRHQKTVARIVSSLSSYWTWLRRRGHAADDARNPWAEQAPPRQRKIEGGDDGARAFADREVALLLASAPSTMMRDFLTWALLTGMRRAEIGNLRVGDIQNNVAVIHKGKTKASRRRVPCHSGLAEIIARRCADKAPDAYLFDELPGIGAATKLGERTDAVGKRFITWRRKLGIQEGEGRRSRVTLHSARHWFDTAAINAGAAPHMVSLVLGHVEGLKGMTLRTYYSGADDAALTAVVELVKLPPVLLAV